MNDAVSESLGIKAIICIISLMVSQTHSACEEVGREAAQIRAAAIFRPSFMSSSISLYQLDLTAVAAIPIIQLFDSIDKPF